MVRSSINRSTRPVGIFDKFQRLNACQQRTFGDETVPKADLLRRSGRSALMCGFPPQVVQSQRVAKALRFADYAQEWVQKRR